MKKRILLSIMLICALFTACTSSSASYWIDNPTAAPITVYIDDTAYEIPATTKIKINLEYGKHQLKYNDQTLWFHNGGRVNTTPAIINPTQSNYVFYKQIFMNKNDERSTDEFYDWALKTQSDSLRLKVNDTLMTLFVPFQVSNKLFISKIDFDWKYNVDEPMPNAVNLANPIVTRKNRQLANDPNYKAGRFQETVYKIFREQDFIEFMQQLSEDKIEFVVEKLPYDALPRTQIILTKLGDVKDEKYLKAVEDRLNNFEQWLDMKGSESTEGFKKFYSISPLKELRKTYLEEHPKDYSFNMLTNELDEQFNKFMLDQLNIIDAN